MKKTINYIILSMVLLLLMPLSTATLPDAKAGECINIKTILNTSSVNISTISYPNQSIAKSNIEMNKIAHTFFYEFCDTEESGNYIYDYVDAEGNVYVNDFNINQTGSNADLKTLIAIIFLTFLLSSLFFVIIHLKNNFNEKKWYNKMKSQYEDRNFVKIVFSGIAYSFMENMWVIYYSLGFIIFTLVADVTFTYNLNSVYLVIKNLLFIYSWSFILVGLIFLSKIQEWIMDFLNEIKLEKWGIKK